MLHWLDNNAEVQEEPVNFAGIGSGWGDGLRGDNGDGTGGWATKLTPKAHNYNAAWESPIGVPQLYLLAQVLGDDP